MKIISDFVMAHPIFSTTILIGAAWAFLYFMSRGVFGFNDAFHGTEDDGD
ncbi:MAG: hypothetical protein WAW00_02140 [Candidatus Moraniibacteriota bacterium]